MLLNLPVLRILVSLPFSIIETLWVDTNNLEGTVPAQLASARNLRTCDRTKSMIQQNASAFITLALSFDRQNLLLSIQTGL